MRHSLALVFLTLTAAVPAQNEFEFYPGVVSFFSRANLGTAGGELLQGMHRPFHRGVGDNGSACTISTFRATIQDQDAATQESIYFIVRTGSDQFGPKTGASGLIAKIGPVQLPAGTGTMAWRVSTTVVIPVVLPNCLNNFAFGVELPPTTTWAPPYPDGLSTHASRGDATLSVQKAHARAEEHTWQIVKGAARASHSPWGSTWRLAIALDTAVLQMGNGGNVYGRGGMFPDTGNPLTARVRYGAAMATGSSLLYMGLGRMPGIPLVPGTRLYLTNPIFFLISAPIPAAGEVVHLLTTSLPGSVAGAGKLHFQAAGILSGTGTLTNVFTIKP